MVDKTISNILFHQKYLELLYCEKEGANGSATIRQSPPLGMPSMLGWTIVR